MTCSHRVTLCLAALAAATIPIGVTLAADSRLDLADDNVEKAIALVDAAQNPNAKHPERPFGGHDTKAVRLLKAARDEIAEAKAYADDPKNWANASDAPTATLATTPGPPNIGRVPALDAIGGALWGDTTFGASVSALDDGSGNMLPAVQLDLEDAAELPVIFTIFSNPGPPDEPVCRAYFQVEVGPRGVILRLDPDAVPAEFELIGDFEPLVGLPPNPCVPTDTR